MQTFEIKNWKTGDLIYSCEAKSLRETVESAVEHGISLTFANLTFANLSNANLTFANLIDANLIDANLSNANLIDANLSNANLTFANLTFARLNGANLSNANLRGSVGNNREVKSLQAGTYLITYTNTRLQIGCKNYSFTEWKDFTDEQIAQMDEQALGWWKVWKPIVFQIIEASPAA